MFYDVYLSLCKQMDKKPSAVAADLKINKSNVSNWKNNGYTPRGEVLQKIADYFGVTTDYLLTGEKEKTPTSAGERLLSDDDMKAAFYNGYSDDLSQDEIDMLWEDAKEYARFKAEQLLKKK